MTVRGSHENERTRGRVLLLPSWLGRAESVDVSGALAGGPQPALPFNSTLLRRPSNAPTPQSLARGGQHLAYAAWPVCRGSPQPNVRGSSTRSPSRRKSPSDPHTARRPARSRDRRRSATRLYLPREDSWLACRRCWGLTYSSRHDRHYKDRFSRFGRLLGVTLREFAYMDGTREREQRQDGSRERCARPRSRPKGIGTET